MFSRLKIYLPVLTAIIITLYMPNFSEAKKNVLDYPIVFGSEYSVEEGAADLQFYKMLVDNNLYKPNAIIKDYLNPKFLKDGQIVVSTSINKKIFTINLSDTDSNQQIKGALTFFIDPTEEEARFGTIEVQVKSGPLKQVLTKAVRPQYVSEFDARELGQYFSAMILGLNAFYDFSKQQKELTEKIIKRNQSKFDKAAKAWLEYNFKNNPYKMLKTFEDYSSVVISAKCAQDCIFSVDPSLIELFTPHNIEVMLSPEYTAEEIDQLPSGITMYSKVDIKSLKELAKELAKEELEREKRIEEERIEVEKRMAEQKRIEEEKRMVEQKRIEEEKRIAEEKRIRRKKIIWGVVGGIIGAAAIGGTIGWYAVQHSNR